MIPLYYLYYFTLELAFKQTIGKFITKTIVVRKDGKQPAFWDIFTRTVSRLVPFDFLSYLFSVNGIHDILSKTELKRL